MIGWTFGECRVFETLDQVGTGVIYEAEDTRLKRLVGLRFLPRALSRDRNPSTSSGSSRARSTDGAVEKDREIRYQSATGTVADLARLKCACDSGRAATPGAAQMPQIPPAAVRRGHDHRREATHVGVALGALLALVVLAAAPGAAQPFTAPKVLAGTAGPAIILLWALATGHVRWRVPTALAVALGVFAAAMGLAAARGGPGSFSQFAFLLSGPVILILILALDEPSVSHAARGLVWAAIVAAAIAIVQRAGVDPWRLAGWAPSVAHGSARMRAYATLGNPNFVASVLAVALPWVFVVARGAGARVLFSLTPAVGILATGSRVGIVAAGVGLACFAWARRAHHGPRRAQRPRGDPGKLIVLGALMAALVLAVLVSERTVGESVAGRLVPLRAAWSHALEQPILGFGLGAVARHYAAWQTAFFADPSRASLARFAGDFDHLHHEPLEWLIETGLVGMAAWIAVVTLALRAGAGRGGTPDTGAQTMRAAAIAAIAAVAIVCLADFPLHRPADYLAAWLALAVAARPTEAAAPSR